MVSLDRHDDGVITLIPDESQPEHHNIFPGDVCVANTFCSSLLAGSSEDAGSVAEAGLRFWFGFCIGFLTLKWFTLLAHVFQDDDSLTLTPTDSVRNSARFFVVSGVRECVWA